MIQQSIKKIKRADRKGSESVTEEKFALLFSTEITITGCDAPYRIQVWLCFDPVKCLTCTLTVPYTPFLQLSTHCVCFFPVGYLSAFGGHCSWQSRYQRSSHYHMGLCFF